MFKKHALQVKMVKDTNKSETSEPVKINIHVSPDVFNTVKKTVKVTSIAVVGGIATLKVVDAACEIAKIYALK